VVFAEEGSACIGAALAVRDLSMARRKRTRFVILIPLLTFRSA
jgi:hypothetical protein